MKSLLLFGSATTNHFDPQNSDLDFAVEFTEHVSPIEFADNYFSLLDSLKSLFQLEVDLLSYRAIKNPVILKEIERSKVELYAA